MLVFKMIQLKLCSKRFNLDLNTEFVQMRYVNAFPGAPLFDDFSEDQLPKGGMLTHNIVTRRSIGYKIYIWKSF